MKERSFADLDQTFIEILDHELMRAEQLHQSEEVYLFELLDSYWIAGFEEIDAVGLLADHHFFPHSFNALFEVLAQFHIFVQLLRLFLNAVFSFYHTWIYGYVSQGFDKVDCII